MTHRPATSVASTRTTADTAIPDETSHIRVAIVDDQNFVQQMLTAYLEEADDIDVVATASDGQSAIEQIKEHLPDIALVDIEMPGIDGLTTARAIMKRFPNTKVLVLSSHDEFSYLNRALQIGVKGYLLKATPPGELIDAIHSVNRGYFQLGPGLLEQVLQTIAIQDMSDVQPPGSEDLERVERLEALVRKLYDRQQGLLNQVRTQQTAINTQAEEWSRDQYLQLEQQVVVMRSHIRYLERTTRTLWVALVTVATVGAVFLLLFFMFAGG
ncbi:MAG: response regulator transcription factor [Cyanobacteria bacterium J06597_1]